MVIPDILSKKESTIVKFRLDSKNGKLPKTAILNHERVVRIKACYKLSFLFSSRLVSIRRVPLKIVINADDKNVLFLWSYISCTKNGISINTPNIIRSMPTAKKTVL